MSAILKARTDTSPAQILGTPSISYYPHPNDYLCQVSECDHDLNDLPKIGALAALLQGQVAFANPIYNPGQKCWDPLP